jgi:hypothetical protein
VSLEFALKKSDSPAVHIRNHQADQAEAAERADLSEVNVPAIASV